LIFDVRRNSSRANRYLQGLGKSELLCETLSKAYEA
jgi:hypothetical protein